MIDDKLHTRTKGALAIRSQSLSTIARELDVTPTTVSIISRGFRRSRRIEEAIAIAATFTLGQLWPARYSEKLGDK